jgi:signal peptidase II
MQSLARNNCLTNTKGILFRQGKRLTLVLAILLTVVTIDQISKTLVIAKVPLRHIISNVPNDQHRFFQITHLKNPGVVFGIFRANRPMAFLVSVFATFFLVFLWQCIDRRSWIYNAACGLIAGGGIGNMIDRLRLGCVTDFLQIHMFLMPPQALNIADICILVGLLLLATTFFARKDSVSNAP